MTIRYLFASIIAAAFALLSSPASLAADAYPSKPIRLVIPWAPGGATDVQMRALAQIASRELGQPIVIENKPGVSGTLGPAEVARAAPDGYTLVQISEPVFRQPYITKTSYDPRTDFTYIMGVSAYTLGLVVRADSPFHKFSDLLDYAKKNPGKLTYATHTGSVMYMVMETLAEREGTKFMHIPTKGTADNNALVLSGDVMASADGAGWASLVNSGKFRLLVTFGRERSTQWPSVPTLKELGFNIVENSPYGLGGPAGMDPKVVRIIYDAFAKAFKQPEHMKVLNQLNQEILDLDPEGFRLFALDSFKRQKALVEKFGLAQK